MICDLLIPFVDGELSTADADRMRAHLATCDQCNDQLQWEMAMSAQLGQLQDRSPQRGLKLRRCA